MYTTCRSNLCVNPTFPSMYAPDCKIIHPLSYVYDVSFFFQIIQFFGVLQLSIFLSYFCFVVCENPTTRLCNLFLSLCCQKKESESEDKPAKKPAFFSEEAKVHNYQRSMRVRDSDAAALSRRKVNRQ